MFAIACVAEVQERKNRFPIGMHGEEFYALDRKRRVDDVIITAWLGARILRISNTLYMFAIACVAEEQERKNRFPIGMHGMDFDELDPKQQVDDVISVNDVTGVTIIVVTPMAL